MDNEKKQDMQELSEDELAQATGAGRIELPDPEDPLNGCELIIENVDTSNGYQCICGHYNSTRIMATVVTVATNNRETGLFCSGCRTVGIEW